MVRISVAFDLLGSRFASIRRTNTTNLISLVGIQGANALMPILVFPYVLIMIGSESFSQVVFLEAISFVFLTIVMFSYDITGLPQVVRANKNGKIAQLLVFYEILYARLILFLTTSLFVIVWLLIFFPNKLLLVSVWLLFPLGHVLQSNYFYNATSNNFPLGIVVVLTRVLTVVVCISFVDESSSVLEISAILSGSYFVSGILSLVYIVFSGGVVFRRSLLMRSLESIRYSQSMFLAGLSVLLYRNSNVIILTKLSVDPSAVSVYAIAEKYVKMFQAISFPMSQLYGKKMVDALSGVKRGKNTLAIVWKHTRVQIVVLLVAYAIVLCVLLLFKPNIETAVGEHFVIHFCIMSFAVFFGVANYLYGGLAFSVLGKETIYMYTVFFVGLASILISIFLVPRFSSFGAAIAYGLSEFLLFLSLLSWLKRITK